jgi:salicylate hydroxylase
MSSMSEKVLIAGGGIAGLATGLALARTHAEVQILERAPALTEVGAGVQLGPNVTRILDAWDLLLAVQKVAFYPKNLLAKNANSGEVIATLSLSDIAKRYVSPYITIHRADLQNILLKEAQASGINLQCNTHVQKLHQDFRQVEVTFSEGMPANGDANEIASRSMQDQSQSLSQSQSQSQSADALVIADGVWSNLRQQLLGDGLTRMTGHLAYRTLVRQTDLPPHLRTQDVSVWMGNKVHVVQYPVRAGEWLNVVCLTEGQLQGVTWQDLQDWNVSKTAQETSADLQSALQGACPHLQALVEACSQWRVWPLCDRAPMQSAAEHAQGRVALLGDAAHPMRPYLAQGAGMAIEDAAELAHQWVSLADCAVDQRFAAFAQTRWQRNARVQARAIRNGEIFHATGPMQWARDAGLRMLGERLMDIPWLYGYKPR